MLLKVLLWYGCSLIFSFIFFMFIVSNSNDSRREVLSHVILSVFSSIIVTIFVYIFLPYNYESQYCKQEGMVLSDVSLYNLHDFECEKENGDKILYHDLKLSKECERVCVDYDKWGNCYWYKNVNCKIIEYSNNETTVW